MIGEGIDKVLGAGCGAIVLGVFFFIGFLITMVTGNITDEGIMYMTGSLGIGLLSTVCLYFWTINS